MSRDLLSRTAATLSLTSLVTWLATAGLFLAPIFLLPIFTNFTLASKLLLLQGLAILFLCVGVWTLLAKRLISLHRSALSGALLVFGGSMLVSSLFTNRYPVEHLLGFGGAFLGMVVIAIVGGSWLRPKSDRLFIFTWNFSLIVLSFASLVQALGVGPSHLFNALAPLNLPHTTLFSMAGSTFFAAQLFALGLISSLVGVFKQAKYRVLSIITAISCVLGLGLTAAVILPGSSNAPLLLPLSASWSIAVETLKVPRTALIGVGPENYVSAYQLFRPAWTNTQAWWATSFTQAFNVPLTLLTTTGILGLVSWIWVALQASKLARRQWLHHPILASVVVGTFIIQLITPINFVILLIQALSLAWLMANAQPRQQFLVHIFKVLEEAFPQRPSSPNRLWQGISLLITVMVFGFLSLNLGFAYAASAAYLQASLAAQRNDVAQTYAYQLQATNLNSYLGMYQSTSALTNVQIANSIARSNNELTVEQQQQISTLLQEALQRARLLTTLRPDDSQSWLVLANVYRAVVPYTGEENQTATQWTVASYVEAINRNPLDARIRLELGQFLLASKQTKDAALLFDQATQLKPDLAAAQYGLAKTLVALDQLPAAKASYQKTLELLPNTSQDYQLAQSELLELEKQLADDPSESRTNPNSAADELDSDLTASASASTSALPALPSLIEQNLEESPTTAVEDIKTTPLGELAKP